MNYCYNRALTICFAVVVCSAVLTASFTQPSAQAQDTKPEKPPVTIILKKQGGISPDPVTVELGTTVVWINQAPEPVTIRFTKPLGIACKVPVNFYADNFGNYETGKIARGETASICFIYKGDFTYEVRRLVKKGGDEPMEEIAQGKIIAVVPK